MSLTAPRMMSRLTSGVLMSKHHAIDDRGWQTAQQRAILRERIDRLLDEHAMRRDVDALVL